MGTPSTSATSEMKISMVHTRASLPESERERLFDKRFVALAAQEHALRKQLRVVGQGRASDSRR